MMKIISLRLFNFHRHEFLHVLKSFSDVKGCGTRKSYDERQKMMMEWKERRKKGEVDEKEIVGRR